MCMKKNNNRLLRGVAAILCLALMFLTMSGMTLFTKNPLERLMMQRPYPGKEETPRTPAPEGHFCCGCSRYGTVCLRPCYRDTDLREKLRAKAPER